MQAAKENENEETGSAYEISRIMKGDESGKVTKDPIGVNSALNAGIT